MKPRATLQTPQLMLRPFQPADAEAVTHLAGDRAIADTTLSIPHPYARTVAETWIATHQSKFDAGEQFIFAIDRRNPPELVGAAGLIVAAPHRRGEIGYWIGKPYWNRGFCTEAGRAILHFGFSVLGLNRIHATHFARNPASGRVLRKLGMRHEGRARAHVWKWGKFEDLEFYGLLKKEWILSIGGRNPTQA